MLRAALITPLSGPLAVFGVPGSIALGLWAEWHLQHIGDEVALSVFDANPDPIDAVRRAEAMKPDLVFGPYGSSVARAVLAATSRTIFNHGGAAVEAPNQVPILSPSSTYFHGALDALAAAKVPKVKVSVLAAASGFAESVGSGAAAHADALGYEVERGSITSVPEHGGVVLAVGSFADEVALAQPLLAQPWTLVGMVSAGVHEILTELGPQRRGLVGPAQWVPRVRLPVDLGPEISEFVTRYRDRTGEVPPYPAAQAFAAGLVAGRCVEVAGSTDDGALLAAADQLDCVTLFGRFQLDRGRQVGHEVLTVQWQGDELGVVWPPASADAELAVGRPVG
ncbi:MAG: ABC transporter substrate-binding protein [Acidimicrobiia bacterium]